MAGGVTVLSLRYTNSDKVTVNNTVVTEPTQPVKKVDEPKATVESLLKSVNEERRKVGVQPLILDERLNKSAQAKSDSMMAERVLSHTDKNGKQGYTYIFDYVGDTCTYASENISLTREVNTSNTKIIDGWVGSKPHYEAMTDSKYTLTGFGIAKDDISWYVTQHFCQLR